MCGRFELDILNIQDVEEYDAQRDLFPDYHPHFNVAPTTKIPIIRKAGNDRVISGAVWGLIPGWAKDRKIAYSTINARSETVAEKPAFRSAYKRKRCLVPATGYYEWQKIAGGKQPFKICRKDEHSFAFAGLFENWTDRGTGEDIESCTIITKPPYKEIAHIHDRMPVILPVSRYEDWLTCKMDDFEMIGAADLDFYRISDDVNKVANNWKFERLEPRCVQLRILG